MAQPVAEEGTITDRVDRQILHALLIDPRASFSRIGLAVGVSEQTAARRYRRLHEAGVLRVVGVGRSRRVERYWLVRLRCRPASASALAQALAARADVSWVNMVAGGTEVVCSVRVPLDGTHDELLLERLPKTREVVDLSAQLLLQRFAGGTYADWSGFDDALSAAQLRRLDPPAPAPADDGTAGVEPDDQPLIAALEHDGRASVAALAQALSWPAARVTRRISALRETGVLRLECEIVADRLGLTQPAMLWLTVQPSRVDSVGTAVGRLDEVGFAAAFSGTTNIGASVQCRDPEHLYELVNGRIGSLAGVRAVEICPMVRRFKQESTRVEGVRLRT